MAPSSSFDLSSVYPPNTAINVEDVYGIVKTGDFTFKGKEPLQKPAAAARGAYGGNIAGQAVLVAIRSSPEGFFPHSLHSYFVKPVSSTAVVDWEVEEISSGKNFCNRAVKGSQDGELKFFANVSLTKRNSFKTILRPLSFQTPQHDWFDRNKVQDIPLDTRGACNLVYHKLPEEMHDLQLTGREDSIPAAERRVSYYTQWGIENEGGVNQPLTGVTKEFQFVGLAVISDALFLTRLARVLRVEGVDLKDFVHYFSVSLDHIIYFHDEDFDTTKWMQFSFKAVRLVNNKALLEAEMYDSKGVHVATVIQEGLVHFNGLESHAKL
ncbi:predicted protein [Scheffersomyces stipitis CBS 6054]|uniref:Uncharacterized protein n=1 Tax=Scheffersomyces stipitis (strain ATCC 58785 / CBS 6054 / NBRC 10063 / NRRL Y-11545) TaxID=322104 RepID=A3LT33_PICST|nr:predicted protein [Scheffersomyces stipitis CBS 6054]ABN65997.2 predicted protein [Scheffersomyces stipitis CBS 6054]